MRRRKEADCESLPSTSIPIIGVMSRFNAELGLDE